MFDSVISCKFSPLVRTIMETELNPNYEILYNFATEDIASYTQGFENFNRYLSVCASGDQVLNGILYGATNIDTFDKNYFAKHILFFELTNQNLAYSNLFEAFKDLNTIKIPITHIKYGRSTDTSQDLALLLTKKQ